MFCLFSILINYKLPKIVPMNDFVLRFIRFNIYRVYSTKVATFVDRNP